MHLRTTHHPFSANQPKTMENKPITDAIMLGVCLLASIFYCFIIFRHPAFSGRKWAVFLLVFLAMNPFLNLWAHLTAISLVAWSKMERNVFVYNFHFYSLLLLGAVFILLSGLLLDRIGRLSQGEGRMKKQIIQIGLVQLLFSLPLFPINPIGLMPGIASVLIFALLPLANQKNHPENVRKVAAREMA
jgi:hypothetical protein